MNLLIQLLSILRALHWSHWTSHWKSKGDASYQSHLLFERLYTGVVEDIDTLAEKIVGEYGPEAIGDLSVMTGSYRFLSNHEGENLVPRALEMEEHLQTAIKTAYETLKANGGLSLGMDDYLMSLANSHETNLYLLRQNLRTAALGVPAARGIPKDAALPPATWLETQLGNVFTSKAAGHEFWFIPTSMTKSNTAKGLMVTIVWAESTKPLKAKQTSLPERDLSGSSWKVIPAASLPDPVRARFLEVGMRVGSTDRFTTTSMSPSRVNRP